MVVGDPGPVEVPSGRNPLPRGSGPRIAVAGAVLLASVALAAATTTPAPPAAPPPLDPPLAWPAWGALGAVLCALAAPRRRRLFGPLAAAALAAVALYAAHGHLRPGFPIAHDRETHLWGLWSHFRCLLDGDPWPRWNPYLGLGMPLLQYYPPAMLYLAAIPMALGASPVQAGAFVVVVAALATGATHAWAARRLGCGAAGSLVAATAAMLGPYRLFDQTYRFALGELLGISLAPLFLVLGREAARSGGRRRWLAFAAAASALLLTHPLTALMDGVVLGAWLAAESAWERRGARTAALRLGRLAGASLLAASLTGAWLLPAALEHGDLALRHFVPGPDRPISRSALEPRDLVRRRTWTTYAVRRTRTPGGVDPADALPFYVGAVLLGAAVAAVALGAGGRRRAEGAGGEREPGEAAMALALLACLALTCGVGWPLIQAVPPLRSMQFLWRFLGPATTLAALLSGRLVVRASRIHPRAGTGTAMAVAALLVADAHPYTGTTGRLQPYEGVVRPLRGKPAPPGEQWAPVEVPAEGMTRVELLRYPPSTPSPRIAKARRVYPEYMPLPAYRRYYLPSQAGDGGERVAAAYGVSLRVPDGRRPPRGLPARAMVALRPEAERGSRDLPGARLEVEPESLGIALPPGHGGGRLRVSFAWYPGWRVRVDGGPWTDAGGAVGLLAANVAPSARRVEFRYTHATPARRAGIAASLLACLGIGIGAVRARGRGERPASPRLRETGTGP